jgi:prolyl-tRNA synthetase
MPIVKNCYFPIFISADNLEREKEHIEGFAAGS